MKAEILKANELSIADYHSSPLISSSKLPDIRPCPALYHAKHIAKTIPRVHKQEWDFGNAFHWRVLEGESAYNSRCIVRPDTYMGAESAKKDAPLISKPWNNNANTCKEWFRGVGGKIVLTSDEVARIPRMMHAIAANRDALALLSGGESETTFRLSYSRFGIQARHDKWHPDGLYLPSEERQTGPLIVDLKTCDSIERFEKDYDVLEYYYRAAFYQLVTAEVLASLAGVPVGDVALPEFRFVAVEKTGVEDGAPLRCEVFAPDPEDLELGAQAVARDLALMRKCHESGVWPSSRMGVIPLRLKSWTRRELAEAANAQ